MSTSHCHNSVPMTEAKFHPSVLPSSISIPNCSSCTIGLDVGHSLTTAVVCSDRNDGLLRYRAETGCFEQLIQEIKQKYSPIRVVRITGGRSQWAKDLVDANLGIVSSLVRDTVALSRGLKHVTLHCTDEDIEFQCNDPEFDKCNKYIIDPNNPFIAMLKLRDDAIMDNTKPIIDTTFIKRPCIIMEGGATVNLMLLQRDWSIKPLCRLPFGEKTFLGLAKALADENDYTKVCKMALVGEQENVDTQVFEMLSDDPKSPYGLFPKDMPMFQFGKGMDKKLDSEHFKPEDLLSSLASLMQFEMMNNVAVYCRLYKTIHINMCGPLFKNAASKKNMLIRKLAFTSGLNINILDTEYAAALGAALSLQILPS